MTTRPKARSEVARFRGDPFGVHRGVEVPTAERCSGGGKLLSSAAFAPPRPGARIGVPPEEEVALSEASRHIVFLRGLNLGRRRLTNDTLAGALCGLGLRDVVTYRASGNAIVTDPLDDTATLPSRIAEGLHAALGYPVPALVRSFDRVRALAEVAPWPPEVVATTDGRVQVVFLAEPPSADVRAAMRALATESDRLAFDGDDLLWLPRRGVSDSPLDLAALDRLGGWTTIRTQGTLAGIARRG